MRTVKKVARREVPYEGVVDPAVLIHSNKTHRSVSEATRDAQYACAITTFKTDTRLAIDFIEKAILGFMWTAVYAGVIGAVAYWFFWG